MKNTFYCKIHTGSMESIEEWNEVQRSLELTNLSEQEKQNILFPDTCEKQCFDCIAEVGQRRKTTEQLIKNQSISKVDQ